MKTDHLTYSDRGQHSIKFCGFDHQNKSSHSAVKTKTATRKRKADTVASQKCQTLQSSYMSMWWVQVKPLSSGMVIAILLQERSATTEQDDVAIVYRCFPLCRRFRKFRSEFKWKVRLGFFRPEYSGSPLEVVHLFRLEYSERNSPFHFCPN